MATNSMDEVEMESARPQHRASNPKSSLYHFTAPCLMNVTRAREDSCSKKHSLQHCVQGQERGEGELHFLNNDIHRLSATLCKELELSLAALG